MSRHRPRTKAAKRKRTPSSGKDSVVEIDDSDDEEVQLTEEQWCRIDLLGDVGARIPERIGQEPLPPCGGLDFNELSVEQQQVLLSNTLIKVVVVPLTVQSIKPTMCRFPTPEDSSIILSYSGNLVTNCDIMEGTCPHLS